MSIDDRDALVELEFWRHAPMLEARIIELIEKDLTDVVLEPMVGTYGCPAGEHVFEDTWAGRAQFAEEVYRTSTWWGFMYEPDEDLAVEEKILHRLEQRLRAVIFDLEFTGRIVVQPDTGMGGRPLPGCTRLILA